MTATTIHKVKKSGISKTNNKIQQQWSKYKIQDQLWTEDTKAPNSLKFQKQNWKKMTEEDNVQCISTITFSVIINNTGSSYS